ncbi:MAG TPA: hypothetical protein DEQ84_05550 [Prevotellaceae bacterium]|nr:hypothetical protein [Prevotellaceae bacterium]
MPTVSVSGLYETERSASFDMACKLRQRGCECQPVACKKYLSGKKVVTLQLISEKERSSDSNYGHNLLFHNSILNI